MACHAGQIRLRCAREPNKIADHDHKTAWPHNAPQRRHCLDQRFCTRSNTTIFPVRVFDELVHIAQRGTPAESGLELAMCCVTKYQTAETVSAMMRRPRQQRCGTAGVH
ncbi:MAG: hypothetical protein IIC12_08040 [Proteobacteria bacterium]|nr:hypothetical protein [Pseudomonadota bacterium]